MVFEGVRATLRGHYLTTVVVAGWVAPIVFAMVAIVWAFLSPTSIRASVDSAGTKFKPDIRMSLLLLIGGLLFIPGGTLFVILVPQGRIDLPMSRGLQISSSVAMAAALTIIVSGLITAYRRGGSGFLRLGLAGVEYADIKSTIFIAWNDVASIEGCAEKNTPKAALFYSYSGSRQVVGGLTSYVPGGGLYWMIRHYWSHAEDRSELVDGRAIERLHEGRFQVDQATR